MDSIGNCRQLYQEEKANFQHLNTIRPETIFICTNRMYQDIDLSEFDSIQSVYLVGSKSLMSDYKIKYPETVGNHRIFKIYTDDDSEIMPTKTEIVLNCKGIG